MTTAARTAALLPLRTGVVLPGSILTIPVGRKKSRALVEALDGSQQPLIVGTQRDPKETDPGLDDVHPIATLARVIRVARSEHGYLLVVRGERRARLDAFETADPYWQVTFTAIDAPAPEAEAEARELATSLADELRVLDPEADGAIGKVLREVDPALLPGRFADRVAAAVGLSYDKDLEVL
ncbi:MAG: LON peptidase substrate-binding domain-containing protein, partial [Planctomycetota bacterium]